MGRGSGDHRDAGAARRRATAFLREAAWLDADRARLYGRTFAILTIVAIAAMILSSHGGRDLTGKPLGTDFLSFWSASKLALAGAPTDVYVPAIHAATERAAFPSDGTGYAAFFYPPVFLLICLPLATMPYLAALFVWLAATGLAYARAVQAWMGRGPGQSSRPFPNVVAAIAYPAAFLNIGQGQNAFLSTALFGTGALLLERRPLIAGLCLGALIFKPHLGILIPFALLAAGQWRAILGACLSAGGLIAASTLSFGPEIWSAFLATTALARETLEAGLVDPAKMQSTFAAARLWNAPIALAYALQALVACAALAAALTVARRRGGAPATGAVLIAATLLASPFLLDYDLVLAAIPMAFVLREGQRSGFLPWDKIVLAAAFMMPLFSRSLAMLAAIPIAPPILLALLFVTTRRAIVMSSD